MTGREVIDVLARRVTFPCGIASKRFVRDMACTAADYVLSERAERFAWRIAYVYRRQLPKAVAEEAVRRKVDHKWTAPGHFDSAIPKCAVCGRLMVSKRENNAPCPGPPKVNKRKKCDGEKGAVAVGESSTVTPQESLF